MLLWKLLFQSIENLNFTWEIFYIRADSPEHAIRLGRAKIEKDYPEDPYQLETLEHIANEVIEDSVPG